MTKYDIRIRRKALTRGQIERHKDFRSIKSAASQSNESGSLVKLIIIGVSLALLVGMVLFGYNKLKDKDDGKAIPPKVEVKKN